MAQPKGRRRCAKGIVLGLITAALAAVLAPILQAFATPPKAIQRSSLRQLVGGGLVLGGIEEADAQEVQFASTGEELKLNENFRVEYPDSGIGEDFFFCGGGSTGPGNLGVDRPRIAYVDPKSVAYAQGLRIGDELVWASKFDNEFYLGEQMTRMEAEEMDSRIRSLALSTQEGLRQTAPGLSFNFKNRGAIQPGQPAKDFKLESVRGAEFTLKELLKGNEFLVLFFRPGFKVARASDIELIRALRRSQVEFAKLGATVATISPDGSQLAQVLGYENKVDFPMLMDPKFDGSDNVAIEYGAGKSGLRAYGYVTERMAYVIDKNGIVQAVIPGIPQLADKKKIISHIADVARIIGGDFDTVKKAASPKPRSSEQMLNALVGKGQPPGRDD